MIDFNNLKLIVVIFPPNLDIPKVVNIEYQVHVCTSDSDWKKSITKSN